MKINGIFDKILPHLESRKQNGEKYMDMIRTLAQELGIKTGQAEAAAGNKNYRFIC